MAIRKTAKIKSSKVTVDKGLEKYSNRVLFKKKLDEANRVLKNSDFSEVRNQL